MNAAAWEGYFKFMGNAGDSQTQEAPWGKEPAGLTKVHVFCNALQSIYDFVAYAWPKPANKPAQGVALFYKSKVLLIKRVSKLLLELPAAVLGVRVGAVVKEVPPDNFQRRGAGQTQ